MVGGRVEHQLRDLLAVNHPAVRRVVPAVAVWVDLAALTGRARGDWSRAGMNVTTTHGLLTGWIRTLGNGWLAVIDTVLPIEGQPACTPRSSSRPPRSPATPSRPANASASNEPSTRRPPASGSSRHPLRRRNPGG